jgi:hypothetical protein
MLKSPPSQGPFQIGIIYEPHVWLEEVGSYCVFKIGLSFGFLQSGTVK